MPPSAVAPGKIILPSLLDLFQEFLCFAGGGVDDRGRGLAKGRQIGLILHLHAGRPKLGQLFGLVVTDKMSTLKCRRTCAINDHFAVLRGQAIHKGLVGHENQGRIDMPRQSHVLLPGLDQLGRIDDRNGVLLSVDDALLRCLSLPGLWYPVRRARYARVRGVDRLGQPVVVEGEGLLARCIQHEVDHLNGQLFVDRLSGSVRKQAMRDLREMYIS